MKKSHELHYFYMQNCVVEPLSRIQNISHNIIQENSFIVKKKC